VSTRSKLSRLSPEDKAKLCALLRIGTPQKWACRAIGLTYDTLTNYRKRAARGEEPYRSFIRDVEQAQAGYVIERLRVLNADAIGTPLTCGRERGDNRALKWLLDRLFPKDFGWRRMRL